MNIAQQLIEGKHAACVNIMPDLTSVYVWEDQLQTENEILLMAKTHSQAYTGLEQCIHAHHPYELPEIIAVPLETGSVNYLSWVKNQITPKS